ncbi:MAG: hypothetical protein LKF87_11295 [Clostridium tyrobutyricum]|jgi:hypothetical protein|uniref:hypothetical protein n=1 Tax=Clostridium tyrobutyricum TaxID=1519 RepID=UPI0024325FF6|nr:hypothetical protein [Clostridium tyrobutyricum]MCH4200924.1 hypothetical protein [Clostridium tyrobutyricum]MCH4236455.1 hypothetical protein [Clostridium tyrobutyricum]MCH4259525.1 hypothetical protein [Clostridium tyrobutyricum]
MSKEEKYYVYKKENGFPAVSIKKQDLPLIAETESIEDSEAAIKKYLCKTTIEQNTDIFNAMGDVVKKSPKNTNKITKKIKFMLGLVLSDRMKNGRDIAFDILIPIQFNSEKEATDNQVLFFAKMEYLKKDVVINIYEKDIKHEDAKIIKTIHWENFYYYECHTTRKESIGKFGIDPEIDEEPCSEKFDSILKNLTKKKSFSLQSLAYWVEPAFQNLDIRQW